MRLGRRSQQDLSHKVCQDSAFSSFFSSIVTCKLFWWPLSSLALPDLLTGNISSMPQLTLQYAVACYSIKLPFSWQLTWQDPLPLRNHHLYVSRQVFMKPSPTNPLFLGLFVAWFVFGFVFVLFISSCRRNRNLCFHSFLFIYPFGIYSETKTAPVYNT